MADEDASSRDGSASGAGSVVSDSDAGSDAGVALKSDNDTG